MRLRVLLPGEIIVDKEVRKVVAEAQNGSFCLLPRHVDYVAGLVPGILAYVTDGPGEQFLGIDEGILVKCGSQVLVSTRNAVIGPNLGELRQKIEEEFETIDEREKKTRSAMSRLEANLVRRFMEVTKHDS